MEAQLKVKKISMFVHFRSIIGGQQFYDCKTDFQYWKTHKEDNLALDSVGKIRLFQPEDLVKVTGAIFIG